MPHIVPPVHPVLMVESYQMPLHDSGVECLCGNAVSNAVGMDVIGPHIREARYAVSVQEVNDLEAILGRDLRNPTMDVEPGVCHWGIDHEWKDYENNFEVMLGCELPKSMEIFNEFIPCLSAW